jgi:hypothetical protein
VPKTSFAFRTDASHKLAGGDDVGDQVHSLPGPDHRRLEITGCDRGSEPGDFFIQPFAEIVLPSAPAFHKAVAYRASGIGPGPSMPAHDVEYPGPLCVAAPGGHAQSLHAGSYKDGYQDNDLGAVLDQLPSSSQRR